MKKLKRFSIFILVGILLFSLLLPACGKDNQNGSTDSNTTSKTPYVPSSENYSDDEVIVSIKAEYSEYQKVWEPKDFPLKDNEIIEISDASSIQPPENFTQQYLCLTLQNPGKENVISAIHQIEILYFVEFAKPHYYGIPGNDENVSTVDESDSVQWALYHDNGINVEDTWNFVVGNHNVRVGILDTGISPHENLNANLINGISYIDNSTTDYGSHGTHVAGIVGATGLDDVSGVSPYVSLVPLKFSGEENHIQQALDYAEINNINIVNMSWWNFDNTTKLHNAINNYDGLFVTIAGNAGENIDSNPNYPGSYNIDNMITVGALDEHEALCDFSNYGENSVDIYAPGGDILSTFPTELCTEETVTTINGQTRRRCECEFIYGGWRQSSTHHINGNHEMSGTSQAAPHVTGVAALLLSYNPNLTAAQLKTAILNGSDEITIEIPDGNDADNLPDEQEVRKLNATKALQYVMDNYGSSSIISSTENTLSETVNGNSSYFEESNFMLKLTVNGNYACRFNISSTSELDVTLYNSNLNTVIISTTSTNGNLTMTFKKYLTAGTYYLQAGYADNDSGTINVTFSGTVHNSHSYTDRYEPALLNHRAYCTCGEYQVKPHIVRVGISGPDSACALCGAPVPTTIGGLNGIQATATYVTLNGSFIAQNGIIYLVDADWDAYFAGTLQFYLNTNLPIVTNRVAIYGEGRL